MLQSSRHGSVPQQSGKACTPFVYPSAHARFRATAMPHIRASGMPKVASWLQCDVAALFRAPFDDDLLAVADAAMHAHKRAS
jgi:hypothetical protein